MKYLPYESYKLATNLSEDEIMDRLDEQIEPMDFFRLSVQGHRVFEGRIISNKFKIQMIGYGNSFRPKIIGHITKDGNCHIISITMRMTLITYVFMSIWIGGVLAAGIRILMKPFLKEPLQSSMLIIMVIFLFGYGLMMYGFKSESSKSKKLLENLFEGSQIT